MNNVFDIKRFGKYFMYDLNNARGNYAVSALVIGLLPLILLVFTVIFSLLFSGEVSPIMFPMKVTILVCAFFICMLSGPVKLYGSLTERRSGSDWLMLPASSFEKFLSMSIMLCIVLPLAVFGLFAICDLLLSWIVPVYGESVVGQICNGVDSLESFLGDSFENANSLLGVTAGSTYLMGWLSWCASVLPFGLGAICFKRGKAAKTILCIIGVQILFSIILLTLFRGGAQNGFELGQRIVSFFGDMTPEKLQTLSNAFINISYFVTIGGLLAGLFFRIKTIKQ